MKIVFLGSFPNSFSDYNYLVKNKRLEAVFVLEDFCALELKQGLSAQFSRDKVKSVFTPKAELNKALKLFLQDTPVDLVVVSGCPIKIKEDVCDIPKYGFLNIHFGKLPENRGADPIFWTLKNRENNTAITIHKMDNSFDTGDILVEDIVPVQLGETSGMLHSKLALQTVNTLAKALGLVNAPENYKKQSDLDLYQNKPNVGDLTIDWDNQTADDIESLVNACNPKYIGAITYYQNTEVKIIEVSPVDHAPMLGVVSGTIVHAHPQEGIYVCCKFGQLIRINIMQTDAGILTGTKYASIGIKTGDRFTSNIKEKKVLIK